MTPRPSIPWIKTKKERTGMWVLKRYGLPFLYWHLMVKSGSEETPRPQAGWRCMADVPPSEADQVVTNEY